MDTTCTSVPSTSISASLCSGRYRIFGELIRNPFAVPHDELTVALRLVRHPVPVPAAGKGLPKDLWRQVGMNVNVSHESDSIVRVRVLKSTRLSLANP